MSITEEALFNFPFDPVQLAVTPRDAAFYGLSLGIGASATAPEDLAYVYEDGLRAFPTIPVILGSPGPWFAKAGINYRKIVHGAQSLAILRPVPLDVPLVARNKVTAVYDKGSDKGAIVEVQRQLETASGECISTTTAQYFCRGDGGFGGTAVQPPSIWQRPERRPDHVIDVPTLPQQALIYRWNGDMNPLHASPEAAIKAGFERPILHGLCTFALAARALFAAGYKAEAFRGLAARMAMPVFPGETVTFDIWDDGEETLFEGRIDARCAVVLKAGTAEFDKGETV